MAFERDTPGYSVSPYISSATGGSIPIDPTQYPSLQLQTPSNPHFAQRSARGGFTASALTPASTSTPVLTSAQTYIQPMQGYSQVVATTGPSKVRPPTLPRSSSSINLNLNLNGNYQPPTTSSSPHVTSYHVSPNRNRNLHGQVEVVDTSSGNEKGDEVPPSTFPYYGQPMNIGFTQLANGYHPSMGVPIPSHQINGQISGGIPRYATTTTTANGSLAGSEMGYGIGQQGYMVPGVGVGTYFGKGEDWLDSDGYNYHPLYQPGAGVEALNQFTASLDGMVGGDRDDWVDLIEAHFDEEARVQLTLTSNHSPSLRLFDISAMALGRILTTWTAQLHSSTLFLRHHVENPLWSPPQSPNTDLPYNSLPRHGIQVESEGEWKFVYNHPKDTETKVEVVWKIVSRSDWIGVMGEGVLKMETWDVVVEEWVMDGRQQSRQGDQVGTMDIDENEQLDGDTDGKDGYDGERLGKWGIPRRVMRELEISQQIEEVFDLLGPAENQVKARAMLDSLVKSEE